MQDHIYYTKYALQFADMQIPELVTVFNQQVGNTGWTVDWYDWYACLPRPSTH